MAESYAEHILAAKLREGLWEAVLESDTVSVEDVDSIRFQKLLLKGIEQFDLGDKLTVEWYLDGEIVSSDVADLDRVGNQTELESAHQFHLQKYPTVDDVVDFYKRELGDSFVETTEDGTFQFLRTYYKEHEDIPYRELYLRNLDIDQALSEVEHGLERGNGLSDEYIEIFKQKCRNLKLELLIHEEFSQIPPYVDVFENGGTMLLAQLSEDDTEAINMVEEYDNFYYYGLWNIVARIIAYHNHSGPSSSNVAHTHRQELQDADEGFVTRYEGLSKWMEQHDIALPALPSQLPSVSIEAVSTAIQDNIETNATEDVDYEPIVPEANLDDNPEEIDLDELLSQDDPSKPLSDLVVEERMEL